MNMKVIALSLAFSLSLLGDSSKEKALKAQVVALQATVAEQQQEMKDMKGRLFTLQTTIDAANAASQGLVKTNAELLRHNAEIMAAQSNLVGQVASTKTAVVDTTITAAKILQGVDTAKAVAVTTNQTLVRENRKRDDDQAFQKAAIKVMIDLGAQTKQQLFAERELNLRIERAIETVQATVLTVQGLMRGLQRILQIAIGIICLLLLNGFLLLRAQFKRRHRVAAD